jgi:cation diffusion facilitator family transporter
MADDCCENKSCEIDVLAQDKGQRRVLLIVLAMNAAMFFVEFGGGLVARSASLMADSADMLGDAMVYAVSLFALSRSARWKAGAAVAKGVFILGLGVAVVVEVGLKLTYGAPPKSALMFGFGALALAANLICLRLLWRFRSQDVNMSSTVECSRNDVISNVGVIAGAVAVWLSGSAWPDILIASGIAFLFLRSAVKVLREALPLLRAPAPISTSPFTVSPRRR